jgi:hypothetical protein
MGKAYGLHLLLKYRATGAPDSLEPDYARDDHVWTFSRGQDRIIVHDIPRLVVRVSLTSTASE